MVKLNKIYTRTGDDGTTGLADGSRVRKTAARVTAYGTVDEANAVIGVARLHAEGRHDEMLARIQNEMFDLGADLSTPGGVEGALRITTGQVERLESEIDAMNEALEPLKSFVLPAGTALAAHLHHARAVVRRAERDAVAAAAEEAISAPALTYLNRLSDHLFVLARSANAEGEHAPGDVLWIPGSSR
ncbi:ATP:cob(I)alamin adenosyltransferase [Pacificimonas flava]|uniref:Corrinoid adenosyltransferase n=2 Tax=Pacificimonas TaxID=1960290 RepID=A0A219B308_9SPHN|nr:MULTISPECIES: cob(I)yrinic acid a,c-diamide adenosyltransferase [Pacificimonas]MBZ6377595.1 cob(I)yrinic acid a,c-diamide adenosyltransferase [Pacificimonas aurantium]OWV32715.1 ATP:cob(I)alamin adenosyltransferase [Pacificimonas flava]